VEYNTAAPALSGITLVPSDLILLNSDQRQTSNNHCESYLGTL
jgi:hypothetical protein